MPPSLILPGRNSQPIAPQSGPQSWLISCPLAEIFFGGARGGGKTYGILLDWINHVALYGADARGIIFRQTFPELKDFLENKCKKILPYCGWTYKVGEKTWYHSSGATLRLGYLHRNDDADKYQGAEYTWMAFDELGSYAKLDQVDLLRGSLRSAAGVPTRFLATGNPGGKGHALVKARYITPADPLTPFENPKTGEKCIFIPSMFRDNKLLAENDPYYLNRLKAVGALHLVKAWTEGDWNIAPEGNIFKREYFQYYDFVPYENAIPGIHLDAIRAERKVPKFDRIIQSWDTAYGEGKENDYSVCTTWGETHNAYYLLDMFREKLPFPKLIEAAKRLAFMWFANAIYVEGKASGISLVQMMQQQTKLPFILIYPDRDKVSRANSVTYLYQAKKVFLPDAAVCPWVEAFVEEHCSFPEGSNDDIVDSATQALMQMMRLGEIEKELEEEYDEMQPRSIYGR